MTTQFLASDIEVEEGRVLSAYPDPLSPLGKACGAHKLGMAEYRSIPRWNALSGAPWTIGAGCTGPGIGPDTVWSSQHATDELNARIDQICTNLDQLLPWWRQLSDPRQDVLVSMCFQMGVSGVLQFKVTLANMKAGDFDAAATGMLQSTWAKQTPARAKRLAEQMRTGVRN